MKYSTSIHCCSLVSTPQAIPMYVDFHFQVPVPSEVVSSLSVPTTDSIHFHPLVAMGNHQSVEAITGLAEFSKFPINQIPFFFQLFHIHSSFVEVEPSLSLSLSLSSLPSTRCLLL